MKKLICWLLALTLAATCTLPVGAVDSEQIEGDPATIPVTVTTIEELLEAIEDAEDGDTIRIGATIDVSENTSIGSSEKRLTLIRSEDMADREVFSCAAPATLENLIIDGNGGSERLIWISADATLSGLTIRNSNGGGIYVQGGIIRETLVEILQAVPRLLVAVDIGQEFFDFGCDALLFGKGREGNSQFLYALYSQLWLSYLCGYICYLRLHESRA